MKAINELDFDENSPEDFNWNLLDSEKISDLAKEISARIKGEYIFIPSQRNTMAGMRRVLNMIAERDL